MAALATAPPNRSNPIIWRTGRALLVAQLASGGLGALAWVVAARTHAASEVGAAIALVAALTLAGVLGNLGLGSLLIALLPAARRQERPLLVGSAALAAAIAGAAFGSLAALILLLAGGAVAPVVAAAPVAGALLIGSAAWATGVVLDHASIAAGRPGLAILRAVTSGTGRLVALAVAVALGARSASTLVIGWAATMALGTIVTSVALRTTGDLRVRRRVATIAAVPLAQRALRTHHLVNVLGQAPPMALPIVLAACGRPIQAAAFGAAWQMAAVVGLLSPAIATGLFAAASAAPDDLDELTDRARRRVLVVVTGSGLVLAVVGPVLLALLGTDYRVAAPALPILAGGLLFDAAANLEQPGQHLRPELDLLLLARAPHPERW